MKKAKLLITGLFIVFLAGCASSQSTNIPILFYGNTCPHCQDLEEKFARLGVEQKFTFERKEVYDNKANANLLGAKAASCGLDTNRIGVPFLYAEEKCFMGIDEIEAYVTEKTGIRFEETQSAQEKEATASAMPQ